MKDLPIISAGEQALFKAAPVPMFIYARKGFRFLAVNDAAIKLYGYTKKEFMVLSATEIRPPEEVERFVRLDQESPDGYFDRGRWLHQNKKGETFYVKSYSRNVLY